MNDQIATQVAVFRRMAEELEDIQKLPPWIIWLTATLFGKTSEQLIAEILAKTVVEVLSKHSKENDDVEDSAQVG